MEKHMLYAAIDFETANRGPDSACALGMVKFRDGVILDEFFSLIRPPDPLFDPINTRIHGLNWDDVKDSPSFPELLQDIIKFLKGSVVMAHNAGFDMKVLRSMLMRYNEDFPPFEYHCTWLLSKKLYPYLPSRSLDALAGRIGFSFRHHDALEDAKACAAVFRRMEKEVAPESISSVMRPERFLISRSASCFK